MYSLKKTIWKAIIDGLKTVIAADAVLIVLSDFEQLQTHVIAVATGIISGIIRGIFNYIKNRNKK